MSNPKAILGVCLIFFFGIITGVALSVRITDARIRQLTTGGPEVLADMVVRRLGRQLELTPVQREKLYIIAKETSAEIAELSASSEKREAAVEKIRAILTPEQQSKFNAILEEDKPIFKIPRK